MSEPSDDPVPDLDPYLADYVSAFREIESPAAANVEETWRRVEAQTQRRSAAPWVPVLVGVAALVIGAVLLDWSWVVDGEEKGAGPDQTLYQSQTPETGGEARPKASTPNPQAEPTVEPTSEPTSKPTSEHAAVPSESRSARRAPGGRPGTKRPLQPEAVTPEASPTALAQETALLRQIQEAWASGAHAQVVQLAREHARRFPRGVFAAERTLAKARGLCELGQRTQAQKLAEQFVKRHPRSHLVPQFEAVCQNGGR